MNDIFTMTGEVPPKPRKEIQFLCVSLLAEVVDYPQHLTLEWLSHSDYRKGGWTCPDGRHRISIPIILDTFFEFRIWSTYTGVHYGTVCGFTTPSPEEAKESDVANPSISKKLGRHFVFYTHNNFYRGKQVEVHRQDDECWNHYTSMTSIPAYSNDDYINKQGEKTLRNRFFKRLWNVLKDELPRVPTREEAEQGLGRESKLNLDGIATIFHSEQGMFPLNWYNPNRIDHHNFLLKRMNDDRLKVLKDKLGDFIHLRESNAIEIPYEEWGIPDVPKTITSYRHSDNDNDAKNCVIHAMGILALLANPDRIDNFLSELTDTAQKQLKRYARYIDEHYQWDDFLGTPNDVPPTYVLHDLTAGKVVYCPPELQDGKSFPCHYFDSVEELAEEFPTEGEKIYALRFHLSELDGELATDYMPNVGVAFRCTKRHSDQQLPFADLSMLFSNSDSSDSYKKNTGGSYSRYKLDGFKITPYFGSEKGYEVFYLDNAEVVEEEKVVATKAPVSADSIFNL